MTHQCRVRCFHSRTPKEGLTSNRSSPPALGVADRHHRDRRLIDGSTQIPALVDAVLGPNVVQVTGEKSWNQGFATAVKTSASYLEASGFRLTSEEATRLRYESSDGVFVLFFLDLQDHYVGFRVGLVTKPRDALTESEVLYLAGQNMPGQYPESPDELERAVVEAARRLREYGQDALSGAPSIYETASALRKDHTERYTK